MELQLVIDNATESDPRAEDVARCQDRLTRMAAELRTDLDYYRERLADLRALDPADASGLIDLYEMHERRLRYLLALARR